MRAQILLNQGCEPLQAPFMFDAESGRPLLRDSRALCNGIVAETRN